MPQSNQARQQGQNVALMANNTDTVARLNTLAQHARIHAGELDPTRPALQVGQQTIGIGDEAARVTFDDQLQAFGGSVECPSEVMVEDLLATARGSRATGFQDVVSSTWDAALLMRVEGVGGVVDQVEHGACELVWECQLDLAPRTGRFVFGESADVGFPNQLPELTTPHTSTR